MIVELPNTKNIAIAAFDARGRIKHAFTTRRNNLGSRTNGYKQPDDWNAVAEEFGISPDRLVTVNQVHGESIVRVEETNYQGLRSAEADALITVERGLAIGVETADCVPILLADPSIPAVAAVHAGWRSTVKRIVGKTVARMQQEFGCDPARMLAAIGPSIGPECYEVDEPVMGPVRQNFPSWQKAASPRGGGKWGLDLAALNRIDLLEAGLAPAAVYSLALCTSCNPGMFYSFRREGRTGRMLSVIMLTP